MVAANDIRHFDSIIVYELQSTPRAIQGGMRSGRSLQWLARFVVGTAFFENNVRPCMGQ